MGKTERWLGTDNGVTVASNRPAPRTAIKVLRSAALFIALVLASGAATRYTGVIDRYLIFFPDREIVQDPAGRGLDFEDVYFTAADGVRLHGWYLPGPGATTVVWFHGNAGNIGHRADNLAELRARTDAGIFIFDYRGYGRSQGSPSEEGTYLDGEAALAHVKSRRGAQPQQKVVLFGRSLGCAVAAEIAARHSVEGLVLESPFTSIQRMARKMYPFLPGVGRLSRTRYDTLSKMGSVHVPVMVLHGDRDEIAPFEMGREVFEAANPPKRFHTIEGAGHNDTYVVGGTGYYQALAGFLDDPATGPD